MKAFLYRVEYGISRLPGTVLEGKSYIALCNQANDVFSSENWLMEIFHDHDKVYGIPDKIIRNNFRSISIESVRGSTL
jgi:hypothetical protein|tara:strand:+ start:2369 stop:2602 length:234 start_codon:yes stop_codon:yes gene_type:complete